MADFRLPPLNGGERLYRALLHLYPARFRRAFGQDLVETFRDQRRHASREGAPARAFWLRILRDLAVQSAAERAAGIWRVARYIHDVDQEESPVSAIPQALSIAEIRYAARRLLRVPSFTVATVLVLALGIGATTVVFSVVNGVLLRPLPYPAPDRLVAMGHTVQVAGTGPVDESDAAVLFNQEHARAFDAIGAAQDRDVTLGVIAGDPAPPQRVSSAEVTANLFGGVLRVRPLLGRGFRAGEDRPRAAPVTILSYRLWMGRFHGHESAIGERLTVDGVSREIVGVMPRDFVYPVSAPELWLPLVLDPATANAGSFNNRGYGRLKTGVTIEAARADLERIIPGLLTEFPSGIPPAMWAQAHVRPTVAPLRGAMVGDVSRLLWILLGSVSMVLVIACANVANLFLVRGESRQLELAVRGALGSGLAGMIAQSLSESIVLAAAGGAIGVAIAAAGVRLAVAAGGDLGVPRLDQVALDSRVLLFALGVSVFCAVFVSLIPVLRARRVPIAMVLREAGRGSTSGAPRLRARNMLVVAQIALALVLVTASGLLARSFARLRQVKPGFDPAGVEMARLVLPSANYPTTASMAQLYDRLLEQARALPGVRDAAITDWVPLTDDRGVVTVVGVEGHPMPANAVPRVHFIIDTDPHFFKTMGIPLVAGRIYGRGDPSHPSLETVVSRAFAERYWPGASPLGKRVRAGLTAPWCVIVGEVGDVHFDALAKPADDALYFPLALVSDTGVWVPNAVSVVVRTVPGHASVAPALRNALHSIDPSLPTYGEHSLDAIVSAASARTRVTLLLLAVASGIALTLGAVGVYGVMAYGVSLRQREIGVRIALGARPADVRRMISHQGVGLALAGVAIGMVCAVAVTRLIAGLLYDVSPTDPVILSVTCIVMLLVALLASWVPAQRAASIDPAEALRGG
jgi:putative ABC transport system permease protein